MMGFWMGDGWDVPRPKAPEPPCELEERKGWWAFRVRNRPLHISKVGVLFWGAFWLYVIIERTL